MAFEVTYTFHERSEDGTYNTTETKTVVKRYGKRYEELPLEKLAAAIMAQLSRRDIWVTDVSVDQYVKRPLKFKETRGGGIVLGNKKFNLDLTQIELVEEDENPAPQAQPQAPAPVNNVQASVNAALTAGRMPLRDVVFDPPPELRTQASALKLTPGKRYAIYEEKPAIGNNRSERISFAEAQAGMIYLIRDDLGNGIWARSFYFRDVLRGLQFENEMFDHGTRESQGGFVDSVRYESSGVEDIRRMR